MTAARHLYCIAPDAGDPVKIGVSRRPFERLSHCDGWSPVPLRPLAFAICGWSSELPVHRAFGAERLRAEWFARSPRLAAFIATLASAAMAGPAIDDPSAERWTARTGESWRAAPFDALKRALGVAERTAA